MRQIVILLAVLCAILWSSLTDAQAPPSPCKDSSECGPNRCCLLSRHRGIEPGCHNAREENATCKPNQPPFNANVTAIDGKFKYSVTNVYIDACPCIEGLDCDTSSGVAVCKKT